MNAGRLTLMLLSAAGTLVVGCGYSAKRPFPQSVRTVYVDMFGSKEFRRGLEMRLTEAVRKRIDMDTDYRNAPRNRADTVLTGGITEFRQTAFASDFRTDIPRQLLGQLVVHFRWKDVRTGRILAEAPNLVQETDYVAGVNETETDALNKAIDDLAERIVERMETPW